MSAARRLAVAVVVCIPGTLVAAGHLQAAAVALVAGAAIAAGVCFWPRGRHAVALPTVPPDADHDPHSFADYVHALRNRHAALLSWLRRHDADDVFIDATGNLVVQLGDRRESEPCCAGTPRELADQLARLKERLVTRTARAMQDAPMPSILMRESSR